MWNKFQPRFIDLFKLGLKHSGFDFRLHLLVGRRQAVHLQPAELIDVVAIVAIAAIPFSGHPDLDVLDDVAGTDVDALASKLWNFFVRNSRSVAFIM